MNIVERHPGHSRDGSAPPPTGGACDGAGRTEHGTTVSSPPPQIAVPGEPCLVQIYGPSLGVRFPALGDEITIGRDGNNLVVVDLDNISRRHARVVLREGRAFVSDLGSTNGTFLNDVQLTRESPLCSGDLIRVGGAIFKFLYGGNVEALYHEEIYRLAIVDGLTQTYNKRYFLELLGREMDRCRRHARPLSLLMFDLDHFKAVNDQHGHLAGDYVLRELSRLVREGARSEECFARFGGEEFALVLPESGPEQVAAFAGKLLRKVARHEFTFAGRRIPVTVSIGVARMTADMLDPLQLVAASDQLLYKAKELGRNRFELAPELR